jgi:deoxyhypusine synthase
VLLSTDAFFRRIMEEPPFQKAMGTAEMHYLFGKYLAAREDELKLKDTCLLTVAYRAGVPLYTSSPGDSSIGMNVAELALRERGPRLDVSLDVNETAAIVYEAKTTGGKSGVLIVGGGSPKNFLLQTEPQIQEVLGLSEKGHDYFIQMTDARADTGGLSGATPGEAVSWGKIDPDKLPDSVVAYIDSTIALPILAVYALSKHKPRPLRRLYDHRTAMLKGMREKFLQKAKQQL